jgi:hypothetical protein
VIVICAGCMYIVGFNTINFSLTVNYALERFSQENKSTHDKIKSLAGNRNRQNGQK